MRLFDSQQNEIVELELGSEVTIYSCGVTPYDSTHIGHAATFLTYDLIVRHLQQIGHAVKLVRNVTDVDDDILAQADKRGVDYRQLVASEVAKLDSDLEALGLLPAYATPHASEVVNEIVLFVENSLKLGYGYEVDGTVFFDTAKWDSFGKLCRLSQNEMVTLATQRGGFPDDQRKRNPLDFVLWQLSADGEPWWDSPWGRGRPGWHIECSVLAKKHLGGIVDIHGGGADLIFPHHDCEIAQSEAIGREPMARYWVHQAMVESDGEKMSKSLGNMVFVSDLLETYDPMAIRLAIITQHYRRSWQWSSQLLEDAQLRLERWSAAATQCAEPDETIGAVTDALADDLNVSRAVEVIDEAAAAGMSTRAPARLLGVSI